MQRRKYLGTISATVSGVALAGCSSESDGGDGGSDSGDGSSDSGDCSSDSGDGSSDGGDENRPSSMEGVTITDRIFDIRDVNNDGEDDLVIGARFDNSNSQEATLDAAYEIEFPDGSTASDIARYTAPPGESTFEGAIRLAAEGDSLTESQAENIKNGEYEYDFWIADVEGLSAESQESSGEIQAGGACTDDNVLKIVDAELHDGIQKTLELAIENIGNEAVYDINIQVNGSGGALLDGPLEAGTRTTVDGITFSERPEDLSDVSVSILGNLGGPYGETLGTDEPCIE